MGVVKRKGIYYILFKYKNNRFMKSLRTKNEQEAHLIAPQIKEDLKQQYDKELEREKKARRVKFPERDRGDNYQTLRKILEFIKKFKIPHLTPDELNVLFAIQKKTQNIFDERDLPQLVEDHPALFTYAVLKKDEETNSLKVAYRKTKKKLLKPNNQYNLFK